MRTESQRVRAGILFPGVSDIKKAYYPLHEARTDIPPMQVQGCGIDASCPLV